MRSSWTCFKWGLLGTVLIGLCGVVYLGRRVDEEVRREVQAQFAALYPRLKVRLDSARLVKGQGVEIKGLRIVDPRRSGPQAELAYVEQALLACQTGLSELAGGDVRLGRCVLRRPRIRCTHCRDGSWTILQLLKPKKKKGAANEFPSVVLENATIEVLDAAKSPASVYTLRDVNLTVDRKADVQPATGRKQVENRPHLMTIKGRFLGDFLRRVEFSGSFQPGQGFDVSGRVVGLSIAPELFAALPSKVGEASKLLKWLRAGADVEFQAGYDAQRSEPWQFDTTCRITSGRIDDPAVPYPLSDLQAVVRINDRGITVSEFSAKNRQTTLRLSATRQGFSPSAPATVIIAGRRVVFDRRMFNALPPSWRPLWREYLPGGEMDIDAKLEFDGRQWRPDLTMQFRNVAFTYYQFPYRLERTTGALSIKDGQLSFDLAAYAQTDRLTLRGEIANPGPNATGWMEVEGKALRITEPLLAALSPKGRQRLRAFHPNGAFDLWVRYQRDPGETIQHELLRMDLNLGYARFDDFPYPLYNVRGRAVSRDGNWTFTDITANNDTARIRANGTMMKRSDGREELSLEIHAERVALEDELRGALEPPAQAAWSEINPQGIVDLVIKLNHVTDGPADRNRAAARPSSEGSRRLVHLWPHGETVSIQPREFPYRWERVRGQFVFDDGVIHLNNVRAEHGETKLSTAGTSVATSGGGRSVQLRNLAVDRVRADGDLLRAAPPGLRRAIEQLRLAGPVNLSGDVSFRQDAKRGVPLDVAWDLNVVCHRNGIHPGLKLENMHGAVNLRGFARGDELRCDGRLKLDSVTYNGFQLTNVSGPLQIEQGRVLFGAPKAGRLALGRHDHITANFYGGTLFGDGWLLLDQREPRFSMRAATARTDLGRLSREAFLGRQNLNGQLSGQFTLNGIPGNTASLHGKGALQLRRANIYQLPLILQLLKVTQLKQPSPTAFTASDVDFQVQGNLMIFDRIDLRGDAVALRGSGQMNFDKQLRLSFRTDLAQTDPGVPIVGRMFRDVVDGASRQIVHVHVGGTLDDPKVRQEPFPALTEAIEQLQPPVFHSPPQRRNYRRTFPRR